MEGEAMKELIEPGDYVKDKLSGYEGVARSVVSWWHNCDRVVVQPVGMRKEKYIPTGETIEAPQLIIVEKGRVKLDVEIEPLTFKYGDKVKDNLSSYEGAVYGFALYLNGCRRVAVQSSNLHEGHPVDEVWFPSQQLSLVKEGDKPKRVSPGGPMPEPNEKRTPSHS